MRLDIFIQTVIQRELKAGNWLTQSTSNQSKKLSINKDIEVLRVSRKLRHSKISSTYFS